MLNGFAATTFDHHLLLLCTSPHSETIHPFHLLIDWFEHHGSSSIWDGVLCIIIASKSAQAHAPHGKRNCKVGNEKGNTFKIKWTLDLPLRRKSDKKSLSSDASLMVEYDNRTQSRSTIFWRFSWMFYSENCCYKEVGATTYSPGNLKTRYAIQISQKYQRQISLSTQLVSLCYLAAKTEIIKWATN